MSELSEKHLEMLSTLITRCAVSRAQMLANPEPYLEKMATQMYELDKCLHAVQYALSPDVVFDFAEEHSIVPVNSIQGEAHIRCEAALKVIREFYKVS